MNETLPFVQGSRTSEAAAASKRSRVTNDAAIVLEFITNRGAEGATDDEIEVGLRFSHQSASARRNGLVRKGLVCDSGGERKTRSGRKATVWILGKGDALVGAPNDRAKRPSKELLVIAARFLDEPHARAAGCDAVIAWLRWMARH